MKTLLPLLLLCLALPARADLTGDFKTQVSAANLKPFALDLGGVLGAASVDPGRRLGFPHVEAGIVSGAQFRPDRNDAILRNSGVKTFGVPLLQAEVGLPFGFDVVAHGLSYAGAKIFGGGARWTAFKVPLTDGSLPMIGVGVFADKVNHVNFSATHYAVNGSLGWSLPIIAPFINAGYDVTTIAVGAATAVGVVGATARASGSRFGGGLDLTPFPFIRLRAAYELLHGMPGATLDLLVKF
jgi:hypothetical protein